MTDVLSPPATADLPTSPPPRRAQGALQVVAATALPVVLFVLLQPETFGITPNPLDPMFYAGLGINGDDAMAVGSNHYFITRWSAWYPLLLANSVAGPFVGRLLVRLVLVVAILLGLWQLRPGWSWSQRLLASTVLVTTPLFLRPLLTDYVEYAIVLYGMGLVLLALRENQTWVTATGAGILTALLLVANPFTVTIAAAPLFVLVVLNTRGVRRKVGYSVLIGLAIVVVGLAGLLWFRVVHDVPDIYRPTINFLRNPPGPDQLKSPRLDWLARFTWLWLPPMVAAVAGLASWRRIRLDRTEWMAVGLCVVQWMIQWADQFLRDGTGLEISYYWSMSFPTLGIALALVVGRLVERVAARWVALLGVGWVSLLAVGVPDLLRLPSGLGFAVVGGLAVAGFGVAVRRLPAPAAAAFLALVAWVQIGAPAYDPLDYHFFDASPRYDRLFWGDGDEAEDLYREAVRFENLMEQVPNDEDSAFLALGKKGGPIVGIYHPHVGGQLVGLNRDTGRFSRVDEVQLVASNYANLVIYGPPGQVADTVAMVTEELDVDIPLVDETSRVDLGYRLVVYQLPTMPRLPLTLEATELTVRQGLRADGDVVVKSGAADFVAYGPYVALEPGRYQVTLRYSSSLPSSGESGSFDVFTTTVGAAATEPLVGTSGEATDLVVAFEVPPDAGKWEFRTMANGEGTLVIDRITIEAG